jgi:hypothetical protein
MVVVLGRGNASFASPERGVENMKKFKSMELRSLIMNNRQGHPDMEIVEAACLLERTLASVRFIDEPELPKGFRHVHSALGALLTIGRDYGF